jgi:hypothetical protein
MVLAFHDKHESPHRPPPIVCCENQPAPPVKRVSANASMPGRFRLDAPARHEADVPGFENKSEHGDPGHGLFANR